MKLNHLVVAIIGAAMLLTGCSGGSAPLKELADAYAEIADNNTEMAEAFQAVYKAPRDEQQALQQKAISTAESLKVKNEKLAKKAASLGEKLQGQEIKCDVSAELGISVRKAIFTTVNAQDKMANIVITAEIEGAPNSAPYFSLMEGDEELYKSAARVDGETIVMNFRITTNNGSDFARLIGKTRSIMLTTSVVAANSDGKIGEPEAAFTGEESGNTVDEATFEDIKIEKGANLVAVLKAAKYVTYEYNADSGIWAHIGNISIVIDEDQLNQKGIDVINMIPSDIEPNLSFSPDYIKPDAKILHIEEN